VLLSRERRKTMKKSWLLSVFSVFLVALIAMVSHAEIDMRDFDADGDVDGVDLQVFAEKFGTVIYYRDSDGDGYSDGATIYAGTPPPGYYQEPELTATSGDCDDEDADVNPDAEEVCDDTIDNNCNGLADDEDPACAPVPLAGDVIITEIMANPAALPDTEGEYFELYNTTAETLLLSGCTISDLDADVHVIRDGTVIGPNASAVFARSGAALGGPVPDYVYTAFQIANAIDEVVLTCESTVIDQVLYDTGLGWPIVAGSSLSLDPSFYDRIANDSSANWCLSDVAFGTGDFGTPGAANPSCEFAD
jgi:hypothetical protein